MARKKTLSSDGDRQRTITFSGTDSLQKDMDAAAEKLGFKGRSEFIRSLVYPVIDKLRTGEIKPKNDVDLEQLEKELESVKKKERKFLEEDFKRPSKVNGKTLYQLLVGLAFKNGCTTKLEGDLSGLLAKLSRMKLVGNEGFDLTDKLAFCRFLEVVLARRELAAKAQQARFEKYVKKSAEGGEEHPLVATPIITA